MAVRPLLAGSATRGDADAVSEDDLAASLYVLAGSVRHTVSVSLEYERAAWDAGAVTVAGIDEVGRGALAGPVSVGVVVLSRCESWPEGLADSKELTRLQSERLCPTLAQFGLARAVGHASAGEIDDVGIVAALRLAALACSCQRRPR